MKKVTTKSHEAVSLNDFSRIMQSKLIRKTQIRPVKLENLTKVYDEATFHVPDYQRNPNGSRRRPFQTAQIVTLVETAYLTMENKIKADNSVAKGTIFEEEFLDETSSDIVMMDCSPIYFSVDKNGNIIASCEGLGRVTGFWMFIHDELRFPKTVKNSREKNLENIGNKRFSEFPEELRQAILNVGIPVVLQDTDDTYERYLYEILNAGCKQTTNDLTNSQCAGNALYDATLSVASRFTQKNSDDIQVNYGKAAADSWKQLSAVKGQGKKTTETGLFGMMSRFLARNETTWGTDKAIKENLFRFGKTYTSDAAEKMTSWAAECIFNAINILMIDDTRCPAYDAHMINGLAAYLDDTVNSMKASGDTRNKKKILAALVKSMKQGNFASHAADIIYLNREIGDPIRSAFDAMTSKDFTAFVPLHQQTYEELKVYERSSIYGSTVQLHKALSDTTQNKPRTDFVRRYLCEKIMDMYQIAKPAIRTKGGN